MNENAPQSPSGTNDPRELFDCLGTIGRGSYGSVYRARELNSQAIVAIKVVSMDPNVGSGVTSTGSAADEAKRELELLESCNSPHVLAVKCSLRYDNRLWIVTELCEGGSLVDVMHAQNAPLTEVQVSAALSGAVRGLCYLHERRMLHRDVKAGNLLLTGDGCIKLGDLGISVQLGSTMARRMTIIGTPHWLAPEVIASDAGYGTAADIWSLGITALELAEMHPPHWDVGPMMRALFKISSAPPPILSNPSEWTACFAEWISLCLQKDPSERSGANALVAHGFIHMAATVDELADLPAKRKQVLRPLAERGVRATTLAAEATQNETWHLDARRHAPAAAPRSAAPAAASYDTDLDPRLNPDLSTAAGSETIDPRLNPDLHGGEPRLKTDLSQLDSLRVSGAVVLEKDASSGENTVHIGREAFAASSAGGSGAGAACAGGALSEGSGGGGTLVLPAPPSVQGGDATAAAAHLCRAGTQEPEWLRDAVDRLAAAVVHAPRDDSAEPQWLLAAAAELSEETYAPPVPRTEGKEAKAASVEIQTQTSPVESPAESESEYTEIDTTCEEEWETEAEYTNTDVDENHKAALFALPPGMSRTPSDALLARILAEAAEAELAADEAAEAEAEAEAERAAAALAAARAQLEDECLQVEARPVAVPTSAPPLLSVMSTLRVQARVSAVSVITLAEAEGFVDETSAAVEAADAATAAQSVAVATREAAATAKAVEAQLDMAVSTLAQVGTGAATAVEVVAAAAEAELAAAAEKITVASVAAVRSVAVASAAVRRRTALLHQGSDEMDRLSAQRQSTWPQATPDPSFPVRRDSESEPDWLREATTLLTGQLAAASQGVSVARAAAAAAVAAEQTAVAGQADGSHAAAAAAAKLAGAELAAAAQQVAAASAGAASAAGAAATAAEDGLASAAQKLEWAGVSRLNSATEAELVCCLEAGLASASTEPIPARRRKRRVRKPTDLRPNGEVVQAFYSAATTRKSTAGVAAARVGGELELEEDEGEAPSRAKPRGERGRVSLVGDAMNESMSAAEEVHVPPNRPTRAPRPLCPLAANAIPSHAAHAVRAATSPYA
jgi:serine/threonine kinase 3